MDEVERARQRMVNGTADALDEWRIKAGERAARREETTMTRTLDTGSDDQWNAWFDQRFDATMRAMWVDGIAETISEARRNAREEFKALLHKLELTVARLEGEVKGLRGQNVATTAKFVGDAIEEYIGERVKAMRREEKSAIIDLPSWRRHGT